MDPKEAEARAAKAFEDGRSAARQDVERGTACWLARPTEQSEGLHPDLGIPLRPVPELRGDEFQTELEAFMRGYNEEVLAASQEGTLRDFRPRVLSLPEVEALFERGEPIKLSPGEKADSPHGRYAIAWTEESYCVLYGRTEDSVDWIGTEPLNHDFVFLPDGETLWCRAPYLFWVIDLPTATTFARYRRTVSQRPQVTGDTKTKGTS